MHQARFISFKYSVIFGRRFSETKYKNTTWVNLPEVDFSFHKDNPKVTEITAQGFQCPSLFPLTFFLHKNVDG